MSLVSAGLHTDLGLFERLRSATLGRYDIYAELGRGGMAVVYLALDVALDRKVAIKAMLTDIAADAGAVERFRREARFAASLSHPNIIPIYTVGDSTDPPYFVMKFVDGRALDSVLHNEGAQSSAFVHAVLQQVGAALDYAHRRSVTHRDIKPANIMLDDDGWILLSDFGIAKTTEAVALTSSGMIVGTPTYMSPEHFNGGEVGPAADQYALGCVAYELLTGQRPFERKTIAEVMKAHLLDEATPLVQLVPNCPHKMAECIHRMISKDPAERFASLAAVVHEIGVAEPEQQRSVTTHIVKLAKSGSELRPRISQPISPVPPSAIRHKPASSAVPTERLADSHTRIPEPDQKRFWHLLFGANAAVAVLALSVWLWTRDVTTAPSNVPAAPQSVAQGGEPSDRRALDSTVMRETNKTNTDTPPGAPKARVKEPSVRAVASPKASASEKGSPPTSQLRVSTIPADIPVVVAAADTQVHQPPKAPLPHIAFIRIGSKVPGALLYVDDQLHSSLSGKKLQWLAITPGRRRIRVVVEGCAAFETTVTLSAGDSLPPLNYRDPICDSR